MLDEQIDQLPTVDQPDARKACFERDIGCCALVIRRGDERSLTTERGGLAELLDSACIDFGAELVALGLDEHLHLRKVGDVELAGRIHAAIAGFTRDFGTFESECGEEMADQNLELLVIEFENLLQYHPIGVVLLGGWSWAGR